MKKTNYQWRVEHIGSDGEIYDSEQADKLSDVWPAIIPDNLPDDCAPVLCLVRWVDYDCDDPRSDDLVCFEYAYPGDQSFSDGHKIPTKYSKALNAVICSERRPA